MIDRRQFLKSAAGTATLAAGSYALATERTELKGGSAPRDRLAGKITFKGEPHHEALWQAASFNAWSRVAVSRGASLCHRRRGCYSGGESWRGSAAGR